MLTLTFATRNAGVDGVKAALVAIIAQAIADVNMNFIVIEKRYVLKMSEGCIVLRYIVLCGNE